jgi:phosphonopyruvate decarboxylase
VGFAADLPAALRAFGFERVSTVRDAASLRRAVAEARPGRVAIAVELRQGSRPDLGRPTTTPAQNKADLMRLLAG